MAEGRNPGTVLQGEINQNPKICFEYLSFLASSFSLGERN
jgi:hypothetical protein